MLLTSYLLLTWLAYAISQKSKVMNSRLKLLQHNLLSFFTNSINLCSFLGSLSLWPMQAIVSITIFKDLLSMIMDIYLILASTLYNQLQNYRSQIWPWIAQKMYQSHNCLIKKECNKIVQSAKAIIKRKLWDQALINVENIKQKLMADIRDCNWII